MFQNNRLPPLGPPAGGLGVDFLAMTALEIFSIPKLKKLCLERGFLDKRHKSGIVTITFIVEKLILCYSEYMSKKTFIVILVLSVVVTWITKEIMGVLGFVLGGLNVGLPLNFYNCSFISSCNINYFYLFLDIIFWFAVIWGIWKLLPKLFGKK